jgi:hypothetical protein
MDRVGEIAELFTWLGFLTGVAVLLIALVVRVLEGSWRTARADVAHIDGDVQLEWVGADGEVSRRFVDEDEREAIGTAATVVVHYRKDRPLQAYLDKRTHGSRVLVLLGVILVCVGIVASIAQLLVLLTRA